MNGKRRFPRLSWFAPEQWQDAALARTIRERSPKSRKYNLYNDLCRAVTRGRINGTMMELKLIASGSIEIPQFGPTKRTALESIINQL